MYIIPSTIAIAIKLWLLWHSKFRLFQENIYLGGFLTALIGLNGIELVLLLDPQMPDTHPIQAGIYVIIYYVFALLSTGMFLAMALSAYGARAQLSHWAIAITIIIAGLTSIPGGMIAGVKSAGYMATLIPGGFFWLIQAQVISFTMIGIGILYYGIFKADLLLARRRCQVLFIAALQLCTIVFLVLISQQFQSAFNVTIIVSLTSSIMLAILIYTESSYQLFHFLSWMPWTTEHRLEARVNAVTSDVVKSISGPVDDIDIKEIHRQIDSAIAKAARDWFPTNKEAAAYLNISQATFYRMLQRQDD